MAAVSIPQVSHADTAFITSYATTVIADSLPQSEDVADLVRAELAASYRHSTTVTIHERQLVVWVRHSERRETAQAFTTL